MCSVLLFIITYIVIIKQMQIDSDYKNITCNSNKTFQEVQNVTLSRMAQKQINYSTEKKIIKSLQTKRHQAILKKSTVYNRSLWSLQQNKAYMEFLLQYEENFLTPRSQRKLMKINVLLSSAVKTRSPDQCRSHHQKMIKYHNNIPNIVKHILHLIKCEEQKTSDNIPANQQIKKDSIGDIVTPSVCEWHSWIDHNEAIWEEMMNERWLDGVEDIYGNI